MAPHTTELVRRLVHQGFPPDEAELIVAEFETAKLSLHGTEDERIHLAVLWLANGDLLRFDEAWREAQVDWRDVLIWAGLANEDWRAVSQGRGAPPTK